MKFGLFHSVQLPDPSEQERYYREALEQVLHAERLGYSSVWFTEHHFTRHGIVSATLPVLSYLAGVTDTIRLGTAVTVLPFHNPVQLAEQTATVDLLSGGRLDLGVGRGYQWGEFHRMGVPMAEATRRFEESMDVLTRAWTSAEPFDHRGDFWTFNDLTVHPKPVQAPHPPVFVAASGFESMARVVRKDRNLLIGQAETEEQVAGQIEFYKGAQWPKPKGSTRPGAWWWRGPCTVRQRRSKPGERPRSPSCGSSRPARRSAPLLASGSTCCLTSLPPTAAATHLRQRLTTPPGATTLCSSAARSTLPGGSSTCGTRERKA